VKVALEVSSMRVTIVDALGAIVADEAAAGEGCI
jgi:hypothetical protein